MRKIEVSQETFDYIHTMSNLLNVPVIKFTETIFNVYRQKNSETMLRLSNEVELAKQRVLAEIGAENIEAKVDTEVNEISLTSPLEVLRENGDLPTIIVNQLYRQTTARTVDDFLKMPEDEICSLRYVGNKWSSIAIATQKKYKLLFEMKGEQNND